MPPARFAALAATLLSLLVFPATGSAAQTLFGSDLVLDPNTQLGSSVSEFNGALRSGSTVSSASAPVGGVLVKMKIKHDGSGLIKWRIFTPAAQAGFYQARSARPDGSTTLGTTVPSGTNMTHEYNPQDAQGDPVGVPISVGEFVGAVVPSSAPAVYWDGVNGSGFSNGTYTYLDTDPLEAAAAFNTNPGNGETLIQGVIEPDSDGDKYGDDTQDACDADATAHLAPCPSTDADNDGIPNNDDNCPAIANPQQENADGDPVGDVCDTDDDNDGHLDGVDNCDTVANPGQENLDGDAEGDVCDADDDGDGAADASDNCPVIANASQTNTDGDTAGDTCDPDDDNDTVLDGNDNCEKVANLDQKNTDAASDGGDACDADDDNDGVPDASDSAPLDPNIKTPVADADKDGVPATQDCNDANAAIKPGAVEILGNAVDENCDGVAAPFLRLGAGFSQSVRATRKTTRFTKLNVTGAAAGVTVVVTCKNPKGKKGCPFKTKTVKAAAAGTVKLISLFKKRKLAVGTVIRVRVTAANSIGPVATYTTRARKAPKRVITCADPTGKTVTC